MRVSKKHFEKIVFSEIRELIASLPEELRGPAEEVMYDVRDNPSPGQTSDEDDEFDLLGIYEGTPLTERGAVYDPEIPDRITLFRHPICDTCESLNELKKEVKLTLIHELGHFFGFSEDELEARGLG
jgi:predicted Zn-dependent protease with MMP-like domain